METAVLAMLGIFLMASAYGAGVVVGRLQSSRSFGSWIDRHGCYLCRERYESDRELDDLETED